MTKSDDWRRQGQERYLKEVTLSYKKYSALNESWDHDHCEFCGAKFMENNDDFLTEGYTTEDKYRWVCSQCFEDFKLEYKWKVKSNV